MRQPRLLRTREIPYVFGTTVFLLSGSARLWSIAFKTPVSTQTSARWSWCTLRLTPLFRTFIFSILTEPNRQGTSTSTADIDCGKASITGISPQSVTLILQDYCFKNNNNYEHLTSLSVTVFPNTLWQAILHHFDASQLKDLISQSQKQSIKNKIKK